MGFFQLQKTALKRAKNSLFLANKNTIFTLIINELQASILESPANKSMRDLIFDYI